MRRDADMLKTLRDQAAIAENSLTLFLVMGLFEYVLAAVSHDYG